MNPREKAVQLVLEMSECIESVNYGDVDQWYKTKKIQAQKCALIAVDEILLCDTLYDNKLDIIGYWGRVKTEILII